MKDKDILTKKQAKDIIAVDKEGMVHTIYNSSFGLIGANHSLESIYRDIDKSFMVKKTGEQAQALGHGLVIIPSEKCKQSELLFVETKNKEDLKK